MGDSEPGVSQPGSYTIIFWVSLKMRAFSYMVWCIMVYGIAKKHTPWLIWATNVQGDVDSPDVKYIMAPTEVFVWDPCGLQETLASRS